MIVKAITFCGQPAVHACDAKCSKAWGRNARPRVSLSEDDPDDYAFLADHELGDAPADPGTTEGGHGKPLAARGPGDVNKWCVRECERHFFGRPGDAVALPDWSQRLYNIHPHTRPSN